MSACVVVRKKVIDDALAQPASPGKHLLEPLKSLAASQALPFNILEDCEVVRNDAEVHKREGDLWLCLAGKVNFMVDGELFNPQLRKQADGNPNPSELYAEEIRGGKEVVLTPGDWLWVPPGQPHQHICTQTGRLVIIKIPV